MANKIPHTIQRNGVYHFNYRVSSQMRALPAYAERDFIRFSLNTRDRATAIKLVAAAISNIDAELRQASVPTARTEHHALTLVGRVLRPLGDEGIRLIGREFEHRFFEDNPLDQDLMLDAVDWSSDDGHIGGKPVEYWQRRKLTLLNPNSRARLDFDEAIIEFADKALDRWGYDLDGNGDIKLLQHLTEKEVECINRLFEIADNRTTGAATTPLSLAPAIGVVTISKLVDHYINHYPKRRALIAKLKPALRAWQELVGIEDVENIRTKNIRAFARDLEKLPTRYAMRFPGLPLREVVFANEKRDQPYERLAEKTIREGYIGPLNSVFSAALNDELIATNPFHGVRLTEVGRATEDKRPYRTHELTLLFQHPIWTGCHSAERRNSEGALIIKDEYYWAPLIALFTGMRADEIADLQVHDILADHPLPHISVKGTKSKSAVRRIPLHPALVEMGFPDYVRSIQGSGVSDVFPNWKPPKGKTKSAGASQRNFNERIIKRGAFDLPKPTFHSFRQTLRSEMERNRLSIGYQRAVMGHSQQGMDKHYLNPDLEEYHGAFIAAVRFEQVDLSHLKVRAFPEARAVNASITTPTEIW